MWESSLGVKLSGQKQLGMAPFLELFHIRVNSHFKETQQTDGKWKFRTSSFESVFKMAHAVRRLVSSKGVFQGLSLLFAFYREPIICTEDVHVHINYYSSFMRLAMITLLFFWESIARNLEEWLPHIFNKKTKSKSSSWKMINKRWEDFQGKILHPDLDTSFTEGSTLSFEGKRE